MPGTGVNDKLSHLVTYFFLAGWFGLLARNRAALFWTFAGLVAYGGLIEILQGTTSYRDAEWADLLADALGAAVGIWLYFTPLRRFLLFVDRGLAAIFLR
ncbi:MAG: VanZ family protein [Gammaproteobacteria bacterium]